MKTSPMHNVGEGQNNSAIFSIIGREKQNKSNVVQYYNARLRFTAKVAAATTIVASENSKQCQTGEL